MISRTILAPVFGAVALIASFSEATNSTATNSNSTNECVPAAADRSKRSKASFGPLCVPYEAVFPNGYCKNIIGYQPVYASSVPELIENENKLLRFRIAKNFVLRTRNSADKTSEVKFNDDTYVVRQSCLDMVDDLYCHHYFKRCYLASSPPPLCREACEELFYHMCDREFKIVQQFSRERLGYNYPYSFEIINCTLLPYRNETSHCYSPDKIRDKLNVLESEDCFYGDGRGYRGNGSVTVSGYTCQSWDSQCPHKHNINGEIYKAINDSGNLCRNPGGIAINGPWCFTTNRTVRWQYCDVPKCPKRPPSSPPINFRGHNMSSISIYLTWGDVPKPFTNGVLLGFHVACKEINTSNSHFAEFLPEEHSWVLKGLQRFTNYSCWLRAYNNFGNGTWSEGLVISTDESAPGAPPNDLRAWNLSSTSLHVQWEPIPLGSRHGNILRYKVEINPEERTDRRHIITKYTKDRSLTLHGLKKYKTYVIKVSGMTRRGEGPPGVSKVKTDEDVPDRAPIDIAVSSLTTEAVKVIWSPVPPEYTNGEVRGYKVLYNDSSVSNSTSVPKKQTTATIDGLKANTNYSFQVLAFTAKGSGVKSEAYFARTFQAGKSNKNPSSGTSSPHSANVSIIVSAVFSASIALGAVLVAIYFVRKRRISSNSDSENGRFSCAVTPYAISPPNWLENVINSQRHGYETLDDDNVPSSTGRPRYININADGSLNLPSHLRDIVFDFEQLYENTRYKHLRPYGRRRSLGGAEDRSGNPMYDKLQRVNFSTTAYQGSRCSQGEQATATHTKQHREHHSVDLGELRGFVRDLQSAVCNMEMTEVVTAKQRRRRRYSVDLGQVREFIALREVKSSANEENDASNYHSDKRD